MTRAIVKAVASQKRGIDNGVNRAIINLLGQFVSLTSGDMS